MLKAKFCLNKYIVVYCSCNKNRYIVAVNYRYLSLTEVDKFLLDFASCLADISAYKKIFIALGDFNTNIRGGVLEDVLGLEDTF